MAEELHPIELDDGNVAPEVRQVVEEHQGAVQQDEPDDGEGIAQLLFRRIEEFEAQLQFHWNQFKDELQGNLNEVRHNIRRTERTVQRMKNFDRREDDFEVGDSVVLLDDRKIGTVTKVLTANVDVLLDDEKSTIPKSAQKSVRKKKTVLMRIYT